MTKQEFIEKWDYLIPEFYHVELAEDFNSVIKQAIAEHEAKQWKKFPENKPGTIGKLWLVTLPDKSVHSCFDISFREINVIAFRELPEAYKEGGEG